MRSESYFAGLVVIITCAAILALIARDPVMNWHDVESSEPFYRERLNESSEPFLKPHAPCCPVAEHTFWAADYGWRVRGEAAVNFSPGTFGLHEDERVLQEFDTCVLMNPAVYFDSSTDPRHFYFMYLRFKRPDGKWGPMQYLGADAPGEWPAPFNMHIGPMDVKLRNAEIVSMGYCHIPGASCAHSHYIDEYGKLSLHE